MAIDIKMPALSPTMEEGTLARWLVKVGDTVASGDVMAEIETDKATMEFEAVDEGVIAEILIEEGTEGVKVGTVIARLTVEGEEAVSTAPASVAATAPKIENIKEAGEAAPVAAPAAAKPASAPATSASTSGGRIIASPLAKRIAAGKGIDLALIRGSGPNGRIVKDDVESFAPGAAIAVAPVAAAVSAAAPASIAAIDGGAPFAEEKLSGVRKVIARRLTESKQTVPHFYLTIDIRLDPLLELRAQLNKSLEPDGVKLSVNDLLIKALARALMRVPQCNVSYHGDTLRRYSRADISVAGAAPSGLITPVITNADTKGLAAISTEMKTLAGKARDGKLMPHEYQGGTASLSNLGMFGIKQFDAVINPPQGMILAVGAGQQQPYVVNGAVEVATVLHASGSFDHRAIDGADGAQLMEAIKQLCENPMGLVV
jgi:pyruvate dehydrogenase E2 component (dihydrolipoamide acetyltransferase)